MIGENPAVMVMRAVRLTVHVPVPLQLPAHPPKLEPAVGVAVRVTRVPVVNVTAQVGPQLTLRRDPPTT